MEHYENKQIFINDKYKGSRAQKDAPCMQALGETKIIFKGTEVL